jgi:hypothetical protein
MEAPPCIRRWIALAACLCFSTAARSGCEAAPSSCSGEATTGLFGEAGALWLKRDRGDGVVLGQEFEGHGLGRVVATITSDSVSYDFKPGMRVVLGYRLTTRDVVAGAGFGLQDWSESAALRNSNTQSFPNGPNPMDSPALTGIDPAAPLANFIRVDVIDARLSSDVHGARLGYRRRVGTGDTWVGVDVRYLDLSDDLVLQAEGPAPGVALASDRITVEARNRLLGGQLSGRSTLHRGRLSVQLAGGVGFYHNRSRQELRERTDAPLSPGVTSPELVYIKGSQDSLATSLELDVTARVRLSRNVSLQGGYQLLALKDLALAPQQLRLIDPTPTTNVVNTAAGTDHSESLLLHGLHVGLHVRW